MKDTAVDLISISKKENELKRFIDYLKRMVVLKKGKKRGPEALVDCGLGHPIGRKELNIFERLSLLPIELKSVEIKDLNHGICIDWDEVIKPFFSSGGVTDRSITRSPHIELIEYYKEHGFYRLKKNFRNLSYYKMLKDINKIGYKTDYFNLKRISVHYTDRDILKNIMNFTRLFESIRKYGYLGSQFRGNYISILEVPFIVSRFGWKLEYRPYELFLGHHRAACLAALGAKKAEVIILKDMKGVS